MKYWRPEQLEKHTDDRGEIVNILPEFVDIKSGMLITGKAGAVRGKHYHKKDQHYCYVLSGSIDYVTIDQHTNIQTIVHLEPGWIVLNEGDELHKFIFKTDGAFIALAKEPRTQESYESDTFRKDF